MAIGEEGAAAPSGGRAWPPALRPGDLVRVVAPSSPVSAELLAGGVSLLQAWGLRVRCGEHVLDRTTSGMLAGADERRAADLAEAWSDPAAAAVFCARGGYGAGRLLDLLDWPSLAAASPRWLVGSSDATALHQAFGSRLGLVTAFGPMPATELMGDRSPATELMGDRSPATESVEALHDLLFGAPAPLQAAAPVTVAPGVAAGRLVGGTLTLLAAGAGTPYTDPAAGCVVLLEDVGEQPYRVDRLLTQLLQSGWFRGVRGVALGTWEGCGDVLPVLSERLGSLGVPVLAGLPLGHGPVQRTAPLGADVRLDATAGTLSPRRGRA